MARKRGNNTGSAQSKSSGIGEFKFINVRLSSDDKAWLAAADLQIEFPLLSVLELVSQGYKFSLNEDIRNSSFVASLTDTREDSATHRSILTGRGATAINAWYALAYRHFHLLAGDWTTVASEDGNRDFD